MKLFIYMILFFGLNISIHFNAFSNNDLPCRESENPFLVKKDKLGDVSNWKTQSHPLILMEEHIQI